MSLLIGIAKYLSDNVPSMGFDPSGSSAYPPDSTYTAGIYILDIPDSPDRAIGMFQYPGQESTPKLGYDSPNIQVRVRGTRDPRTAISMANSIYNQLHGLTETELYEGTYITTCVGLQSGPVYLGKDANKRHEFSLNFRLQIRNPSVHREPAQ